MKAAENRRSVIVGIFVLIGIILFIAGVFILGGQQKRFESTITLYAVFDDVGGLRNGNNIWFSGVKIGTVRGISFHGEDQVQVAMRVEQDAQRYIRKNAKVRITSESLIGNRIIEISGGTTETPNVESGDRLETEMALNTDDMMATLQENNENLVSITRDFKELSARLVEGQGTVGALLTDSTMADNFREVVSDLQQVSANTVRASGALSQFTTKLNQPDGLATQLLTDTVVFQQLRTAAEQLQQTTSTASAITENLNEASSKLNSTDNSLGILLNDQQVGNQLKNTMENVETSSEKMDHTLDALQYHWLFRGAFRRQARQEARQE
ncbi:hypothetical protein BH23BAC1_BH23BAC1_31880 [soil metagenome]